MASETIQRVKEESLRKAAEEDLKHKKEELKYEAKNIASEFDDVDW